MKAAAKSKKRTESIFKRYSSTLKNFINKQISSGSEESEDILQDVFYRFIIADGEDEAIENVSSWLYKVARNQIIDRSRKHKDEAMPYVSKNRGGELLDIPLSELLRDNENTVEDELMRQTFREELETALSELPLQQRSAFELNELQGISFKEISEATGMAIPTLISQKRYAILHLRERLAQLYTDL